MESLSLNNKETALHILKKINEAIDKVLYRTRHISCADDFLLSPEGLEKLDAACMVIEAIGESIKNLDKVTSGRLLVTYPKIEWKQVMGARDVIAHHYFDIDAYEIYNIINNDLATLKEAIIFLEDQIKK